MAKKDQYYKGQNWFFKFLRFLNLLEPNKPVLSLSKVLLIVMIWMFVHITVNSPDQIAAVLTAGGGVAMAMLNYGYRRHKQYVNHESPYSLETPTLDNLNSNNNDGDQQILNG